MMTPSAFVTILAQAQTSAGQNPPAGILAQGWVMPVLLFVMFYFLLIRPQQRQRKEQQNRINSLQAGDRVVTTAGLHGLVHNIKDRTVVLKVADGVMLEFEKAAVASVAKKDADEAKK
jgi:preprotein translocase subunit YajC